jgi:hypothetical protein
MGFQSFITIFAFSLLRSQRLHLLLGFNRHEREGGAEKRKDYCTNHHLCVFRLCVHGVLGVYTFCWDLTAMNAKEAQINAKSIAPSRSLRFPTLRSWRSQRLNLL